MSACGVHVYIAKLIGQITIWPKESSDTYTGVVFAYYNTGCKEIVDVNVTTNMQEV